MMVLCRTLTTQLHYSVSPGSEIPAIKRSTLVDIIQTIICTKYLSKVW